MTQRGVLVVTGLPGTGKTTPGFALARELPAPLLSKDAIKAPLLDRIGAPDRTASRVLSDASFAVMFALGTANLVQLGAVVLEGNFRPGEHEPLLRALPGRHACLVCTQVLCWTQERLRHSTLEARTLDIAPARPPRCRLDRSGGCNQRGLS